LNGRNSVIEGLVRNVENLLEVLELVAGDLVEVRNSLRSLLVELQLGVDAQAVMEMLPERLRKAVSISDEGDYITVKLKRLLKAEAFKALVEVIITKLRGEYVSTGGGGGYFRIPKTQPTRT